LSLSVAFAGKAALLLDVVLCLSQSASADLTDYAIFGNNLVAVGSNGSIGGPVGSNYAVYLGPGTTVYGRNDNPASPAVSLSLPTPPAFSTFLVGSGPVSSPLPPGRYGLLNLLDHSTLTLTTGDYYFDTLIAGSSVNLTFDLTTPGDLRIYVKESASLGSYLSTSLVNGSENRIFTQTDHGWFIGSNSNWFGTVYAPLYDPDRYDQQGKRIYIGDTTVGTIAAGSDFTLNGALYGQTIAIGDRFSMAGWPVGVDAPFPVPAPGAVALGAIGLGLIGFLRRRF
jgi:hypothetical protein